MLTLARIIFLGRSSRRSLRLRAALMHRNDRQGQDELVFDQLKHIHRLGRGQRLVFRLEFRLSQRRLVGHETKIDGLIDPKKQALQAALTG